MITGDGGWRDPGLWTPRQRCGVLAAWALAWAAAWVFTTAASEEPERSPSSPGESSLRPLAGPRSEPRLEPAPSALALALSEDDRAAPVDPHHLLSRLASAAASHGVRLERFVLERASPDVPRASVQVLGPYPGLAAWMASLPWGDPSVRPERLRLTPVEPPPTGLAADAPTVRMEALLALHPPVSSPNPVDPQPGDDQGALGSGDPFHPARLGVGPSPGAVPRPSAGADGGARSPLQRPLSELTLVGILQVQGHRVALIVAGGEVHEVREGDALGPGRRPVRRIGRDAVELTGASAVTPAGRSIRSGWLILEEGG